MAEIYGDLDMSESSILGTCCHVSIDDAEMDEDIIDMLRECIRERMLHITYIIDEMIYVAAMHATTHKLMRVMTVMGLSPTNRIPMNHRLIPQMTEICCDGLFAITMSHPYYGIF